MDKLYTRFDHVFFERTRLSILTLVKTRNVISFNGLKQNLRSSDGALFSHLTKLVEAGYISRRKELAGDTVQTVYSLTPKGDAAYDDYVIFLQEVLQHSRERV